MLYGFSYLTVGEKDYEPYTAFGLWFAKDQITAITEIITWNYQNGVRTIEVSANLITTVPKDVRVENGRLVR